VSTAARTLLQTVARAALTPRAAVTMDAWADEHRRIPERYGGRPGRWSTAYTPYLREIMRCLSDPGYDEVTLMKGSQIGGTEVITNALLYWVDVDPGPMMCVYPNADLARAFNTERLVPSIIASPRSRAHLRDSAHDVKGQQINFDRCSLFLVGSNSQAHLEMRSIRYVCLDETDNEEFGPEAAERARQRTKFFHGRSKIIDLSKPSYEHQGVHARYLAGDQRRYVVPCPFCRRYQPLVWGQVRWEGGRSADPDEVEHTAWYECERCRGRIENARKAWMLAMGRWVARGQVVEDDGSVVGTPARQGRHASFQISTLYSPVAPFGYVAKVFLKNGAVATKEWANGELGEPWAPATQKVDAGEAREACTPVRLGGYRLVRPLSAGVLTAEARRADRPRLPEGVLALVGAIDLQRDRAYALVRGFGERGMDSWLVWYGVLPCSSEQAGGRGLAALDRLVDGTLLFAHPADGGTPMGVQAWVVDSGEGRRTVETYQWVMRWPRVFAGKGEMDLPLGKPWEHKDLRYDPEPDEGVRPSRSARAGAGGQVVRFLRINTTAWKDRFMAGLKRRRAENQAAAGSGAAPVAGGGAGGGGMGGGGGGGGALYLPEDADDEYLRQITSEHQVPGRATVGGAHKRVWTLRPGARDNHYLDCETMVAALADSLGVRTMTRAHFAPPAGPGRSVAAAAGSARAGPVGSAATGTAPATPRPATPAPADRDDEAEESRRRGWLDA